MNFKRIAEDSFVVAAAHAAGPHGQPEGFLRFGFNHEGTRIDRFAVDAHFVVEVRAGR